MSDSGDRGEQRPGRRNDAPRGGGSGPRAGKPADGRPDRPARSDRPDRPARSDRPDRAGQRPPRAGGRPAGDKVWTRDGKPARGDRDARSRELELTDAEKEARALRSVRPRHDDPEIPLAVTAKDLDRMARNELKTLSKENAEEVARHLAMAAKLIESDPPLAHRHATSAARRAGRIGVVRETLAITAYATGDFALAIRELRTYRRISGSNEQLALMVDSERGVGRPDRALEVGRSVPRSELSVPTQVAVAIAMSGARLDLGQTAEALGELEIAQLNPDLAFSYSPDLFSAYADVLQDLGRDADAELWRERADRAEAALGGGDEDLIEVYEEEDDEFFEAEDVPSAVPTEQPDDSAESDQPDQSDQPDEPGDEPESTGDVPDEKPVA